MKTKLCRTVSFLGLVLATMSALSARAATPPVIECSPAATLECTSSNGAWGVVHSTVLDADGDALLVVWAVNGHPVQTNIVASGIATNTVVLALTNQFALGTNDVSVGVTDDGTNVVMCSTSVVVRDATPPMIEWIKATPNLLWPPNHKLKTIQVRLKAADVCGPVTWRITDIESNEPIDGRGDGSTSPDWLITGLHKAMVRAERAGPGNGRVYTLHVRVWDTAGNSTNGFTKVYVPHDRGHGRPYHDKHDFEDDDAGQGGSGPGQAPGNGKSKSKGKGKSKDKGNGNGKGK